MLTIRVYYYCSKKGQRKKKHIIISYNMTLYTINYLYFQPILVHLLHTISDVPSNVLFILSKTIPDIRSFLNADLL